MNEQQVGKASRIASLIIRRMQHKLTDEERNELDTWIQENGENFLLYDELMDKDKLGIALDELSTIDNEAAYERLTQKLALPSTTVKRIVPKIWWYMVAAVLLMIGGSIWYLSVHTGSPTPPVPVIMAQKKQPQHTPDSKKAILTLADGSAIVLNEMNNGVIAQQGNSIVQKKRNGQLEYHTSGSAAITGYNTIRTPRGGGEYQVVLEDGTIVWLNVASSLQFPVHFNNKERRVILTGEAYFEVAPSLSAGTGHKKAFIVQVDSMQVQAIGTAFDIAAYKEDNNTQTTVVEGLVKVTRRHQEHLLTPGKKMIASDSTMHIEEADIKQATAWKDGEFVFRNSSLQMVMNELARWYDMDVVYKAPMPSLHFSGEIKKQSSLIKVLEMLELTGGIQFKVVNRTIQVFPNAR